MPGVDPTRWIVLAVLASAAVLVPACGRSADCPGERSGIGTAEGGGGAGSGALTMISANIYLGGKKDLPGLDRMACYLGDADVVFLQETDEDAARALARESGLTNLRFARAQDPRKGGYGVAILSRSPLGPAEEREFPETEAPYDVVLKTAVRLRGKPVALIDAFYAAGYDEEGRRARLRASEVVVDLLDEAEGPVVLGGDLNATAGRPGIPPLAARMTDSFEAAPRGRCHCEEPYGRIDYIFFRGPFAVRGYEAPCWSRWPWWPSREADPPEHEEAGCSPGRAALSDHPFVRVRLDMTGG